MNSRWSIASGWAGHRQPARGHAASVDPGPAARARRGGGEGGIAGCGLALAGGDDGQTLAVRPADGRGASTHLARD